MSDLHRIARQQLLDAIPVAVFGYGIEHGKLLYVNAKFAATLGYTPEEILALPSVLDIIADDQRDIVAEMIRRREAGDESTTRFVAGVRTRDGAILQAEVHGSVADHESGRIIIGAAVDITAHRDREEYFRALADHLSDIIAAAPEDRLTSLGRLSAQMAHEFNNVLMGIQPMVDRLRRQPGIDPSLLRCADSIAASIARGKRITTDILRFARPAQPVLEFVPMQTIVQQAADELRPLLPDNIAFEVVLEDEPTSIHADAAQLLQVLINLGLNARDAMQHGGTLTISALPDIVDETKFVHLTVRDTGSGIAADDLPYIFEPLFSTKSSGTGLGLSVVLQIVSAHGGHITVDSERGRGTAFHLLIPAK